MVKNKGVNALMLQSPSPQANHMDYKKWKKQNAVLVFFSGWFLCAECVECQYCLNVSDCGIVQYRQDDFCPCFNSDVFPFICYKNSLTKHYFLPFVFSHVTKTFLPAIKHNTTYSFLDYVTKL